MHDHLTVLRIYWRERPRGHAGDSVVMAYKASCIILCLISITCESNQYARHKCRRSRLHFCTWSGNMISIWKDITMIYSLLDYSILHILWTCRVQKLQVMASKLRGVI